MGCVPNMFFGASEDHFGYLLEAFLGSKWLPRPSKWLPKSFQSSRKPSKTSQGVPRWSPRGSQEAPRGSQEASRGSQKVPKRVPRGPKRTLDAPNGSQKGSRSTQDASKRLQTSKNMNNYVGCHHSSTSRASSSVLASADSSFQAFALAANRWRVLNWLARPRCTGTS